ncbi:MAG TPA: ABC transporter ATP-binding protein, partial [Ilumatobacteraceae bacterium]
IEGSARLRGRELLTARDEELREVRGAQIAMIFQDPMTALNPVHRVGDQIVEQIRAHDEGISKGAAMDRTVDLLEQVGIPRIRRDAYPHELSGGQKQRVMIAMALACDPELLIADEPTTALDVMVQAQVLQLLAELQRDRGLAMIFITHDLSVLSTVADRLAVMYAGRLVETGPAKEMLRGAKHPYTKALAAAFPTIGDAASRLAPSGLAGDPPDPAAVPRGCPFHPRCPMAIDECAAVDVELREIVPGWEVACIRV